MLRGIDHGRRVRMHFDFAHAVRQAISGARGASLEALSYRDGGLDLKLRAGDAESLERIDQAPQRRDVEHGWVLGAAYDGQRIRILPASSDERERHELALVAGVLEAVGRR